MAPLGTVYGSPDPSIPRGIKAALAQAMPLQSGHVHCQQDAPPLGRRLQEPEAHVVGGDDPEDGRAEGEAGGEEEQLLLVVHAVPAE